ncbi:MAG: CBS domain-containing protein [Desulfobacteraceae bacterium]
MFVSDSMTTELITITPDVKIFEARRLMQKNNIRHLPVIDDGDRLLGMVSDRDLRDAMPSSLLSDEMYQSSVKEVMEFKVKEVMTEDPVTISPFFTIQDALMIIQEKRVGAFPVVDENGIVKGLLSTRDLLKAFVNVMGIKEPGTLLCILVTEKPGQLKKIVDVISEEKISLGSVLVARYFDENKRAVFPYLLTNNVINVKKRIQALGFSLIDPMEWYLDQLPKKQD